MSLVSKRQVESQALYLSTTCDRLTVAHVVEFADALRSAGVGYKTRVSASVNHSTLHCTGLSVKEITEEITEGPA